MDSPGLLDDEVIADSEGEMDDEEHPGNLGGILSANVEDITNTVSHVSAFTLPGQVHGNTPSSISAFTAGPSVSRKQTSNKGGQLNQLSDIDNFLGTASIADRAKTRQRNPKSSIQSLSTKPHATASSDGRLEKQKNKGQVSSDIIELTSNEEDDELSLRPSKPRPKPKLKVKDKSEDTSNNKTLNASDTTEANTDYSLHQTADLRPRPRPRPLMKRNKTALEATALPPPLPLDISGLLPSSSASYGPELPIATSPIRPHLQTSQLPPSDPPLPTLTTIHDENDLPPIETLPNLDFDGPLSSPSSLFSDLSGTTRKRKRTILDPDIDELASDVDLGSGKGRIKAAQSEYDNGVSAHVPLHMPPPPTFFAGSSSSSMGGGDRRTNVPSELAHDVVDLTMLPPTIQPTAATTAKKVTKAKTSRQKKAETIRMDEDELDDDFDPTESTKKGKPKSEPKAKKGTDATAKQSKGRALVEVSIVSKPRTKKSKGKATAGDKDTFKIREFIGDSGDEDTAQLIPSSKDSAHRDANHGTTTTNEKAAHIPTSTTSKKAETSLDVSSTSNAQLEENTIVSPSDPEKSRSSSLRNRINKKRKSVIESDLEDEDEGEKNKQAVETSMKRHKGNHEKNSDNVDEEVRDAIHDPLAATKKGKKGKGKDVAWSEEDDEDSAIEVDLDPLVGLSKGPKPASRIEDDTDEERSTKKRKGKGKKPKKKSNKPIEDVSKDDNDASVEDHIQVLPLAPVAKENVIPPMKSTAKASKTDDRPNIESPAGLFPSLHSRYEIAPRRSSLPMSELIRRANSIPGSPFATPHPRASSSSIKSGTTVTYSPYLKSSRSLLSRIAPLHPNRRTPPRPPPPAPPRKKTKKELEMEEKWEEEMIDSVGGISEWTCLGDDEKKELRRAKWAREMGDWDD